MNGMFIYWQSFVGDSANEEKVRDIGGTFTANRQIKRSIRKRSGACRPFFLPIVVVCRLFVGVIAI